jgi:hypothetical protein
MDINDEIKLLEKRLRDYKMLWCTETAAWIERDLQRLRKLNKK